MPLDITLDISKIRGRVEAKLRARGLPVPPWSKIKWEEVLMDVRDNREMAKIEKAPLGVSGRAEVENSTLSDITFISELSNSKVGDNAKIYGSRLQSTFVFGEAVVAECKCSASLIYDRANVDYAYIKDCRIRGNAVVRGQEENGTLINVNMSGYAVIENSSVRNAKVSQDANIFGGASIWGHDGFVQIYGKAKVSGRKTEIRGKAQIYGSAIVSNGAELFMYEDYEIIMSVSITDDAQVYEEAEISGGVIANKAQVYGKAKVRGRVFIAQNAQIRGQATIYGNYPNEYWTLDIRENAIVEGQAIVEGRAIIQGNAIVGGTAHIGGDAIIKGGVWNGEEGKITTGTWLAPGVRETKERSAAYSRGR